MMMMTRHLLSVFLAHSQKCNGLANLQIGIKKIKEKKKSISVISLFSFTALFVVDQYDICWIIASET